MTLPQMNYRQDVCAWDGQVEHVHGMGCSGRQPESHLHFINFKAQKLRPQGWHRWQRANVPLLSAIPIPVRKLGFKAI